MSLNPSDYSREQAESTPVIRIRYRGACRDCETAVQATVRRPATSKQTEAWVRCDDCGQITLCDQKATVNQHGGGIDS